MPARKAPEVPASTVIERRIRIAGATFQQRRVDLDGSITTSTQHAPFGTLIALDPQEAMRLDVIGALAPEGSSLEDVESERERGIQAYRAARQQHPGTVQAGGAA